ARSYPANTVLQRIAAPGMPVADMETSGGRLLVFRKQSGQFDVPEPTTLEVWSFSPLRRLGVLRNIQSGAYDVDRGGSRLALGHDDGSITITDLATSRTRTLSGRHNAPVLGVAFSPDGRTLVSTGDDKQVLVWDTTSGQLLETLEGHAGRTFG